MYDPVRKEANPIPKPQLLLFSHICSPEIVTGAEKLLLLFARELQRHFRCTLVVPREGAISAGARAAGMEIAVVEAPLSIGMYTAHPALREEVEAMRRTPAWGALARLIGERRPACALVNTCVHPLPAMVAKSMGVPTIWTMMETMTDTPSRPLAAEIVNAYSDRIAGISQSTLSPFPPDVLAAKAVVLPPYLHRAELNPDSWPAHRSGLRQQLGFREEHRVVGFIAATIYPNKGLRELTEAFLPLAAQRADLRALVVGDPVDAAHYEECRALARQAGLADRIAYLPFAPRIEQVIPAMDVVAVPSLIAEGFGMTALEGLMCGKPVVAFASGGLKEILAATGQEAFLAEPGNAADLSAKLALLLGDDALREAAGRQGAALAEAVYGLEAFRGRLDAFVASLPLAAIPPGPPARPLRRSARRGRGRGQRRSRRRSRRRRALSRRRPAGRLGRTSRAVRRRRPPAGRRARSRRAASAGSRPKRRR